MAWIAYFYVVKIALLTLLYTVLKARFYTIFYQQLSVIGENYMVNNVVEKRAMEEFM